MANGVQSSLFDVKLSSLHNRGTVVKLLPTDLQMKC